MASERNRNRCVQCGFGMNRLFVQYSPGNIRLMKCDHCKSVADEYIECEFMIVLIDLILHKPKAYRHLLYNLLDRNHLSFQGLMWKSAIGFLLLDAYRCMLLSLSAKQENSFFSSSSLVASCQKILMDVFVGNIMFFCAFLFSSRVFLSSAGLDRYKDLLFAIIISSYFKIFIVSMMVWDFPSPVIFIIDLFVLSSNVVAIKVTTAESPLSRCIGTCLCAHSAKLLASKLIQLSC